MARKTALDSLRLVAALGVVGLHEPFATEQLWSIALLAKSEARWCVPFFFMLSGFFLPTHEDGFPCVSMPRLKRVLMTLVAANLIYLPLAIVKSDSQTSVNFFHAGLWFHLWYVNSLLLGMLSLAMLPDVCSQPSSVSVCVVVAVLLYWVIDAANQVVGNAIHHVHSIIRHFQSICFLWIGHCVRSLNQRRLLTVDAGVWLVVGGVAAILVEDFVFVRAGWGIEHRQFPLGAAFFAIGVLVIGSLTETQRWCYVADLGRRHSLPIYILHPLFLAISRYLLRTMGLGRWELVVVFGFASSLLFSVALHRCAPRLFVLLAGHLGSPRPKSMPPLVPKHPYATAESSSVTHAGHATTTTTS